MMKFTLLPFLILAIAMPLWAQQSSTSPAPLPDGPLLKRVPDNSAWTVTIKGALADSNGTGASPEGAGTAEKPRIVAQSTMAKSASVILERRTDPQGRTDVIWHIKNLRAMQPSGSKSMVVSPEVGGGDIYTVNFSRSDFSGLDWISADTYTGTKKYQGTECMVFQGEINPLPADSQREERIAAGVDIVTAGLAASKGKPATNSSPHERAVSAIAYIDLETRLPIVAQFGKEKRSYEYRELPSPLTVPDEVMKVLDAYAKRMARLTPEAKVRP